jgi:hypothetical protein
MVTTEIVSPLHRDPSGGAGFAAAVVSCAASRPTATASAMTGA